MIQLIDRQDHQTLITGYVNIVARIAEKRVNRGVSPAEEDEERRAALFIRLLQPLARESDEYSVAVWPGAVYSTLDVRPGDTEYLNAELSKIAAWGLLEPGTKVPEER